MAVAPSERRSSPDDGPLPASLLTSLQRFPFLEACLGPLNLSRQSSVTANEEVQLNRMLESLADEELELAARSSYEYLQNPVVEQRNLYAKQMAKRFLRSKNDETKALEKMRATIAFRKEFDVDALRETFTASGDGTTTNNKSSSCSDPLKEQLMSKTLYVQGYDRDGRSTFIFVPRNVVSHDPVWTLKGHIYTLERAIACSKSPDRTVNAVVDFQGFSAVKHSPPIHIGKQFMTALRSHYAGSINQIFLVDAPTAFLWLWTILTPFIGRKTKDKINFVDTSSRERLIGQWYDATQAAPWMLPQGQKKRELDLDEYLYQMPFTNAFDE
jgi:hypothetical protein